MVYFQSQPNQQPSARPALMHSKPLLLQKQGIANGLKQGFPGPGVLTPDFFLKTDFSTTLQKPTTPLHFGAGGSDSQTNQKSAGYVTDAPISPDTEKPLPPAASPDSAKGATAASEVGDSQNPPPSTPPSSNTPPEKEGWFTHLASKDNLKYLGYVALKWGIPIGFLIPTIFTGPVVGIVINMVSLPITFLTGRMASNLKEGLGDIESAKIWKPLRSINRVEQFFLGFLEQGTRPNGDNRIGVGDFFSAIDAEDVAVKNNPIIKWVRGRMNNRFGRFISLPVLRFLKAYHAMQEEKSFLKGMVAFGKQWGAFMLWDIGWNMVNGLINLLPPWARAPLKVAAGIIGFLGVRDFAMLMKNALDGKNTNNNNSSTPAKA